MFLTLDTSRVCAQTTFIAYDVPAGTPQDQTGLGASSVGMDFDVANEIIVTRLGVFDAASDGISEGVTLISRLWDRSQDPPVQIASLEFTSADSGELIGGSRFKPLDTPLHLPAGFRGTTTGDGWADTDSINNSFGATAGVLWTLHDGNGSIEFVGGSRYGTPADAFPVTVDTGPAARFASSTFEFQTTAPIFPGKPNVSVQAGDQQIILSWPAVTQPAPAAKYRVSRSGSADGPFTQLAEITSTSYTNSGLVNGVAYSYTVAAVTGAGQAGSNSVVKSAAAYLIPTNHFIAYFTPGNTVGNQAFGGSLGLDFDVQNPVIVKRLGVFDEYSDGIKLPLAARIWNRDTMEIVVGAEVFFTPDDPGELIEGMRFRTLDQPLRLEAGFHGVMQADGYGPEERERNSGGNPNNIVWTLNSGNGSILFVGRGRNGTSPGIFPETLDGGPAARYAAGTFEFESLAPAIVGVPQVTVTKPFEDGVVTLYWLPVTEPLPAVKYEVQRSSDVAGPFAKIGETTDVTYQDKTVQNGSNYFFVVRAVGAGGQTSDSAPVSATPNPTRGGIAYIVPAGLVGNQPLPNYSVGMDFDVAHPIKVTKLGVFDDGSDGITMRVASVLFNRVTREPLAVLEFTPENQGELIDGSRFLSLPQPLTLDDGFQGSIVMWFSNDSLERNYNTGGNPDPAVADLQIFDGGSIRFVGASRYGASTVPETFPATVDGGPVNRYGAGTFAFEPAVVAHPTLIAYAVPANTNGNQAVAGAAIGMDFDVKNEIVITRLGVFDDGSDGLKQRMTARIWDRNPTNPVPVLVATVGFTLDNQGELIGGSRFKSLQYPLHLQRGFRGTISVDYYDSLERIRNSGGDPANVTWTLNDGNGSITFVGTGRYGGADAFPANADGGPAARYASGSFEYQTRPPTVPGQPIVTVHRPLEDAMVTLNWIAVTNPLPAAKYEILRGSTNSGPFVKIGETTDTTYQDKTAANGTTYYYVVHAVASGGQVGDDSVPVSATPTPIQGGIAYIVRAGLAGNQNLANTAVGLDFDVVLPIRVTRLGVFDDSSDGLKMTLTAVLYDRATQQALATQEFTTSNQGELIGGSRFLTLAQPVELSTGFQGSMVIWFSNGTDEKLFNTFGTPAPADLQLFDGGSILFVGGGRYGGAGTFPGTADGGPVNRYAGATFAFEAGTQRPVLQFMHTLDKLKLTWTGGGVLERVNNLGETWQQVQGAVSGIEVPITGFSGYFRVKQ